MQRSDLTYTNKLMHHFHLRSYSHLRLAKLISSNLGIKLTALNWRVEGNFKGRQLVRTKDLAVTSSSPTGTILATTLATTVLSTGQPPSTTLQVKDALVMPFMRSIVVTLTCKGVLGRCSTCPKTCVSGCAGRDTSHTPFRGYSW